MFDLCEFNGFPSDLYTAPDYGIISTIHHVSATDKSIYTIDTDNGTTLYMICHCIIECESKDYADYLQILNGTNSESMPVICTTSDNGETCDDVNSNSTDPDIVFGTCGHTPCDFIHTGNSIGGTSFDSTAYTTTFIDTNDDCTIPAITAPRYVDIFISQTSVTHGYINSITEATLNDIIPSDVRTLHGSSDNSERVITRSISSPSATTTDVSTQDSCPTQDLESPISSDMSSSGTYTSGHTDRWGKLLSDILSSSATSDQYGEAVAYTTIKKNEGKCNVHVAMYVHLAVTSLGRVYRGPSMERFGSWLIFTQ